MNKTLKLVLIILAIAAFAASCIWYYKGRDWEPLIAIFTSLAALVTLIFVKDSSNKGGGKSIKQKQRGGDSSTNYQSGGNITIEK